MSADIAIASALLVRPLTQKEEGYELSEKLERFEDLQNPGLRQCSAVLGSAQQCSAVLGCARQCSAVLGSVRQCSAVFGSGRKNYIIQKDLLSTTIKVLNSLKGRVMD